MSMTLMELNSKQSKLSILAGAILSKKIDPEDILKMAEVLTLT